MCNTQAYRWIVNYLVNLSEQRIRSFCRGMRYVTHYYRNCYTVYHNIICLCADSWIILRNNCTRTVISRRDNITGAIIRLFRKLKSLHLASVISSGLRHLSGFPAYKKRREGARLVITEIIKFTDFENGTARWLAVYFAAREMRICIGHYCGIYRFVESPL